MRKLVICFSKLKGWAVSLAYSLAIAGLVGCGSRLNITMSPGGDGAQQARVTDESTGTDPAGRGRGIVLDKLWLHLLAGVASQGVRFPGTGCSSNYWWDQSPNAFGGALVNFNCNGAPAGSTGWVGTEQAASPYALMFDGADDHLKFGDRDFSSAETLTFEFWIKPASTQKAYATLMSKHDGSPSGFTIEQSNTTLNKYYFAYNPGNGYIGGASLVQLASDKWQQFVVVKDGNVVTLYVNGVQSGGFTGTSGAIVANNLELTVGQIASPSHHREWKGQMAKVAIYTSALSEIQVKQNCDALKDSFVNGADKISCQ